MSTNTSEQSSSSISLAARRMIADLNTPWKMRLYFLQRLPSLWFWGVRVKHCDAEQAQVTLPFNWRSQNPFRSTYFAALCGAGELSTGLLSLIAIGERKVSMLVVHLEMEFVKKATDLTTFTCTEGSKIQQAVRRAIELNEPQTVKVTSVGTNEAGETVAKMTLSWSFKAK